MWSRKVKIIQEKLNSGVMDLAAEVARDLHRGAGQEEPSYSQRQLYENALSRVVSEMAIVRNVTENQARAVVEAALAACPPTRRSRKATGEGDEAERMDEAA
jgi:CarD family transcriptional regulator